MYKREKEKYMKVFLTSILYCLIFLTLANAEPKDIKSIIEQRKSDLQFDTWKRGVKWLKNGIKINTEDIAAFNKNLEVISNDFEGDWSGRIYRVGKTEKKSQEKKNIIFATC